MRFRLALVTLMATLAGACATAVEEPEEGSNALSCQKECACTECSATLVEVCNESLDDLEKRARDAGCNTQLASHLRCISEDATCNDGTFDTSVCNPETTQLHSCINGAMGCSSVNNGTCDEPEGTGLCADGTDVEDCAVSACTYTNDGSCDEPEGTGYCDEGTDVNDCMVSSCPYTNDGSCDEPEGSGACAEGTDVNDCTGSGCLYTNNGTCDEPEGTGLCSEGTDVEDCATGTCAYTNDGECDEPEGTGLCPEGSDQADCT